MRESLIREIYFGTYDPKRGRPSHEAAGSSAFDEILALSKSLMNEMPDSLKEQFGRFSDACLSLLSEQSVEDFEEGYRLGVRLMVAALTDEAKNI